jgi:hypothetical protein
MSYNFPAELFLKLPVKLKGNGRIICDLKKLRFDCENVLKRSLAGRAAAMKTADYSTNTPLVVF